MNLTRTTFVAVLAGLFAHTGPAAAQLYRSTNNPYGTSGYGSFKTGGSNAYNRPTSTIPSVDIYSLLNGNFPLMKGTSTPYGSSRVNLNTKGNTGMYTTGSTGTYTYRPSTVTSGVGAPSYPRAGPRNAFDRWVADRGDPAAGGDNVARQIAAATPRDIASGQALNLIVKALEPFAEKLKAAPPAAVDEAFLRRFNFTPGTANVGLLREEGKIEWPKLLLNLAPVAESAKIRQQIDTQFGTVFGQVAAGGRANADDLKTLSGLVDHLNDMASAHTQSLTFAETVEVKQQVRNLEDSVAFLKRPDAAEWLPGKAKVKADSLQELVTTMQEKNIRFGPAFAGGEATYATMHRALAALYAQMTADR